MRLDKWLWAARFFKTRSQAAEAAEGGKVKLNGAFAKPAKELKPGDRLHIRAEVEAWEVEVLGFNAQRRPAAEARLLYRETPESMKKRAEAAELRRLSPLPQADAKGRPTKRDRRQLNRLRGGE
jgi:ribosome-associated heat shock protein Hsp15